MADEQTLPKESAARKALPITTGVIDYFPAALAAIAQVSKYGNDKHNPGEPLHWTRGKSNDHADAIARHLIDRGKVDPDTGVRHTAELAWRALALLQVELEEAGEAPLARGAVAAESEPALLKAGDRVRDVKTNETGRIVTTEASGRFPILVSYDDGIGGQGLYYASELERLG